MAHKTEGVFHLQYKKVCYEEKPKCDLRFATCSITVLVILVHVGSEIEGW
jgi:hypothetical protein